ncbi:hypothetical protein ACIHEJ_18135 [Streptomyces sp. NPDC052301]|uniref:hypothetical protein n=1 Tax=Streptomyces sp. NPDC052301 TaxID=3365687 RepID=UPI0037D8AFCE
MTPGELVGIVSCFKRPDDRVLVRLAYGTGLRAVLAAYASARADALRICGLHPDRAANGREPVS